jgi:hypothetical protein
MVGPGPGIFDAAYADVQTHIAKIIAVIPGLTGDLIRNKKLNHLSIPIFYHKTTLYSNEKLPFIIVIPGLTGDLIIL